MSLPATVKSWHLAKGYGFVSPSDGTEDVYVGHETIGGGYLQEGGDVYIEVSPGPRKKSLRVATVCNGAGVVPRTANGADSGIVKTWKPEAGYGFAERQDGKKGTSTTVPSGGASSWRGSG
eukprot:Sspe_Gene.78030::Locus_48798_Transcript_1_1_Confidence_1.000_Length_741::g.78030::m.78030